MGENRSFL